MELPAGFGLSILWKVEELFLLKLKNLHNAVTKNNLVQICITSNRKPVISNKSTLSAPKFCLFGLLNCQSVRNKYLSIKDYVVDKDFDIFAITETWLNTGDYDNLVIGSLIPNGYRFLHSARDGRGGGVGLLFKSSLPVKQTSKVYLDTFISFEAIKSEVKIFSQYYLFPSLLSIVLYPHLETIFQLSFL